jgi:hypothetical protein
MPYVADWPHLHDHKDLLWVGFDVVLKVEEIEQNAQYDTKNAFLGVELDVEPSEVGDGFLLVSDELVLLPSLDDNIIDVSLDVVVNLSMEVVMLAPLVGGACIIQSKWHRDIEKRS